MKWLLIYAFDVEIYQRAPIIRIFLEDVLLNEFTLEKKVSEVIEFEYDCKDTNKLTVEFINDDNNYTNGFMNKYTKIIPLHLYIVPYYIVKNYSRWWLRHELVFSKRNYYMHRKTAPIAYANTPKYKEGLEYIKHYYKTRASCPQNIFALTRDYKLTEDNLMTLFAYGQSKKYNYILDKKHNIMFYQIKPKGFVIFEYYSKSIFEKLEQIYQ
jgi:hypothetical protein